MSLNRENISFIKCVCLRNLCAIQKPQPQQGFCYDFFFFNKPYFKWLLRMLGLYKRLEKWRGPKDWTQMVTTNPEFLKD